MGSRHIRAVMRGYVFLGPSNPPNSLTPTPCPLSPPKGG